MIMSLKQKKRNFKPKIKLNHNIYDFEFLRHKKRISNSLAMS